MRTRTPNLRRRLPVNGPRKRAVKNNNARQPIIAQAEVLSGGDHRARNFLDGDSVNYIIPILVWVGLFMLIDR